MRKTTVGGSFLKGARVTNAAWIEHQTGTPEARREYEQERLVVWATDALYEAMEEAGLSKAELAKRIGTSRAYVTQAFSGTRNMTLRTLADFAWACDSRFVVSIEPLRTGEFVCAPVKVVRNVRPRIVQQLDRDVAKSEPAVIDPFAA